VIPAIRKSAQRKSGKEGSWPRNRQNQARWSSNHPAKMISHPMTNAIRRPNA